MDKLKGQIILLFVISFCLISLVIFTLLIMFQIEMLTGLIGVVISLFFLIAFYFVLEKPSTKTINKIVKELTKSE